MGWYSTELVKEKQCYSLYLIQYPVKISRISSHLLHLGLSEQCQLTPRIPPKEEGNVCVTVQQWHSEFTVYQNQHEETKYPRHLKGKARQDLQKDLVFLTDN